MTRLVVERGRARKRLAGKLDSGLGALPVAAGIARVESLESRRGCRCDCVEDAEEGVAVARLVARDQGREVEVVAGVHADAGGKAAPHLHLAPLVEERHLDAVDPSDVGGDDREAAVGRAVEVGIAPVAGERGSNMSPSQWMITGRPTLPSTRP